eukprot:SAG31_NODE_771_length_12216_cov_5.603862_8_plen_98_part_00
MLPFTAFRVVRRIPPRIVRTVQIKMAYDQTEGLELRQRQLDEFIEQNLDTQVGNSMHECAVNMCECVAQSTTSHLCSGVLNLTFEISKDSWTKNYRR